MSIEEIYEKIEQGLIEHAKAQPVSQSISFSKDEFRTANQKVAIEMAGEFYWPSKGVFIDVNVPSNQNFYLSTKVKMEGGGPQPLINGIRIERDNIKNLDEIISSMAALTADWGELMREASKKAKSNALRAVKKG